MVIPVILTFIAVFLVISAAWLAFVAATESPKAALKRRLRRMAMQKAEALPEELRAEILKETTQLDQFALRMPFARMIERLHNHSGVQTSLTVFFLISCIATVAAFTALFVLTGKYFPASLAAFIALLIPILYLQYLKNKRVDKFTEQLPEALAMIARSLRAGHSLTGAIELVGQEMAEPAQELFRTAYEQQKLGLRMTDSLANMAQRIESLDLRFFVTAVTINSEVGGNLAETLDKLGNTIRERLKIRRQVKVYTAQGRMSGYVLGALPIATFFLFNIMMPGYEDVLFREKTGQYLLAFAVVAQLIGFFIIRKIINIRI